MASGSEFKSVKVYVPVGSLGVGVFPEDVEIAMAKRPDVMAMDAGSTDSGAAYLAKQQSQLIKQSSRRSIASSSARAPMHESKICVKWRKSFVDVK